MTGFDVTALVRSGEARRFLRFCVVGGLGFVTDLGVLLAAVWLGAGPLAGRGLSFGIAVVVTWLLNRTLTFKAGTRPSMREFASYLSVQIVGLLVNLTVYVTLIAFGPGVLASPAVALAIASAIALVVNYSGARSFAFHGK
ncbi:GtrA family protein [Chelatococcus reniformis]|uniref:GtrA/DPMS transmembrane domain-containing protein n=1 Tax=Chelatococcus reniformis TaxID=1494448 RepID=A0A916X9S1_9HYPH|nr:GtrA family protein [Chelatococcus reniformis]GGC54318.1 hypothetical protein GCM10010994_11620 [Chelatococcus reniformis]